MSTFVQKLGISVMIDIVFLFVNLPSTYKFTNNLLSAGSDTLFNSMTKCPTMYGQLVHTLVFSVIIFLQMFLGSLYGKDKDNDQDYSLGVKLKHTFYSALIFFFLSSPVMYKLVGAVLGTQVADVNGCPTLVGIFIHAVVYVLTLIGVMYFPN